MKNSKLHFGEMFKYYRKKKGLTLEEIGKEIGKSKSALSKWENNDRYPKIEEVEKLATYFGTSVNTLLFGADKQQKISTSKMQKPTFKYIPLIGTIACGKPITAVQNIDEYISTIDHNLPSGDLFYLRAKGNSMEPKIPDGAEVLCREQPDVENGEIAAVLVNSDEEATLKRVHKFDNHILLEAINEEYAPYLVDKDHPARIVGKVVSMKVDF